MQIVTKQISHIYIYRKFYCEFIVSKLQPSLGTADHLHTYPCGEVIKFTRVNVFLTCLLFILTPTVCQYDAKNSTIKF